MVETPGRVIQRIVSLMSVNILHVQISITTTTTACSAIQTYPSPRTNVQSRVSELQLGFALSHIYLCPLKRRAAISSARNYAHGTSTRKTTDPGDKLGQVFRQHVGEPDGTTLLERQRALRRVRARREVRNPARVEDVLSLDAVRAAPQQRLGPRDARLRRVLCELARKRERGREHVRAVREGRVVEAVQERRVGRVRVPGEQQRDRARITEEAREEIGRDSCQHVCPIIQLYAYMCVLEYGSQSNSPPHSGPAFDCVRETERNMGECVRTFWRDPATHEWQRELGSGPYEAEITGKL
jgi:hypothetical protein